LEPRQLANFVLTTMEGGVMLARTHRSFDAFDLAVASLRDYIDRLIRSGTTEHHDPAPRTAASRGKGRTP
ncbi:MAG: hypothetical protein KDA25_06860, partial [Phycisphaerales bacterium]|nr:hypothetical protein [Phycisphaerales bacterium]